MLEKGLVQIYTGDGKGKTTAAFGQALRAVGQGNKVLIYQFLKPASLELGERLALEDGNLAIKVSPFELSWDMCNSLDDEKVVSKIRSAISEILSEIAKGAKERLYDVFILDEIIFCLSKNLAQLEEVKHIIEGRDKSVEIILTGRGASEELMGLADLITEMKNIKHPFDKGQSARRGIEF